MGDDKVMRIGIRVDANETIATGHVMRCLAIAEELKKMGENPLFISADDFPRYLVEQKGYELVSLQSDWKFVEEEIDRLSKIIEQYNIRMMLVDSYYVTKPYLERIHALTKVIYIEDLGKDIYDVDAVICYANYYKDFLLVERYPSKVKLLQGTRYTPLRSVFSNLPPKKMSSEIKNLIVLSGGIDLYDFLWNFSKRIQSSTLFANLDTINIICGKYYIKYNELVGTFGGNPKFHFYKSVEDIEKYMLTADVAISAAGVTSYELCAAGVPSIIYTIADNQKKNAESFHKDGLMEYTGDLRYDLVYDRIMELMDGKYQSFIYRENISKEMRKKVDGKGALRIVREICQILYN